VSVPASTDHTDASDVSPRWGREDIERLRRLAREGGDAVGRGHQGDILATEIDGLKMAVKTVHGRGPVRWIRRWMLTREHRAYERLAGVVGVPRCFGLVGGEFLLLERVAAEPYRVAQIHERDHFYERLLTLIRDLHDRGVAHGDIKGKNNVLVGPDEQPYLVDFGASSVQRSGFSPLHQVVYRFLAQTDFNSYVKLKYDRDYSRLSAEDAQLFRRTLPERVYRKAKWGLLRLRFPSRLLPVKNRLATGGRRPSGASEASVRRARQRLERLRGNAAGAPVVRAGDLVALQTFDSLYAEVEQSGRMVARSERLADAQLFEVGLWIETQADDGESELEAAPRGHVLRYGDRVTFRSLGNHAYVAVATGGRRVLVARAEHPSQGGIFTVIPSRLSPEERGEIRHGEFFGLQSQYGWNFRYAADTDGELTASSPRSNFWESVALVAPPEGAKT